MRLAWFRPAPLDRAQPLDATAALIVELQPEHDIDVFTRESAHQFVWKQFRAPYDVCVCELDNDAAYAFIWPYLLQYGGVLLLRSLSLHDSRAQALLASRRREDYTAEFWFNEGHAPPPAGARQVRPGTWPMLRAPLLASRLTVVPYRSMAEVVGDQYPEARVMFVPPGVPEPRPRPVRTAGDGSVTFGMVSGDRVAVGRRAIERAREAGAPAALVVESPDRALECDVIVALAWPWRGDGTQLAWAAMAAGKPVLTIEQVLTADWPALDPQTWQPRGALADAPVAVTVDLRDEEHSLAIAIRRLSADAALRARLGEAAYAWWEAHCSTARAADAWRRVLAEAATRQPPPRPADWPAHLSADGTERAREILGECGVHVDLFD